MTSRRAVSDRGDGPSAVFGLSVEPPQFGDEPLVEESGGSFLVVECAGYVGADIGDEVRAEPDRGVVRFDRVLDADDVDVRAPEELLRTLIEAEITAREASNARTRLNAAAFPVTKTLDEFDLSVSSINTATFNYLALSLAR